MNGKGVNFNNLYQTLYDRNGKVVYDGSFKDDVFHGHGTSYNSLVLPILSDINPKSL